MKMVFRQKSPARIWFDPECNSLVFEAKKDYSYIQREINIDYDKPGSYNTIIKDKSHELYQYWIKGIILK